MKKILLAVALICLSAPAFALQQCTTQAKMFELLSEGKYVEFPIAAGIASNGSLFEIYHNEETGSFTAVVTTPNKISCIATAGEEFYIKSDEQRKLNAINRLPSY